MNNGIWRPGTLRGLTTPRQRRRELRADGRLHPADYQTFAVCPGPWNQAAERLIENAIGCFPVPLGLAEHFVIDGRETPVIMATEERSIVAAAAKAAKLCRPQGFRTLSAASGCLAGHAVWGGVKDPPRLIAALQVHADELRHAALRDWPEFETHGRRVCSFRAYQPSPARPDLVVAEIMIETGEAMGANIVTRLIESYAREIDRVVGNNRLAAIVSNAPAALGDTVAEACWPGSVLPAGLAVRLLDLQTWAELDPNRTATHVKGIMNAVTAIGLATGQDTRALEAAVHAAANRVGGPRPLTQYRVTDTGDILGRITVPLAIGTVGGATKHPIAGACRETMGANTRARLASVMAAAGLAQNFAALLCLAGEGITAAHRHLADGRNRHGTP